MIKLPILCLLIIPVLSPAQGMPTDLITNKADSIIIARVGIERFRKFFSVDDENSIYIFTNRKGEMQWMEFFEEKYIKGALYKAQIQYNVCFRVCDIPCLPVQIHFDNQLRLQNDATIADLDNIPSFLWEEDSCRFISYTNAKSITDSLLPVKNRKDPNLQLIYSRTFRRYAWTTMQIIQPQKNGAAPIGQFITLDAITGQILENKKSDYILMK